VSLSSVALACLVFITGGCRGRAQEDLYRQTLQREVRQLEDQLYEADYENRILIDKLRRERLTKQPDCPDASSKIPVPPVDPGYVPVHSDDFDMGGGFDKMPVDDAFESRSRESNDSRQPLRDPKAQDSRTESIPPGRRSPDRSGSTNSSGSRPSTRPVPDRATDKSDDLDGLPDMDSLIDPGTPVDPSEIGDTGDFVDPEKFMNPGTLQTPVPTPIPTPRPDSSPPGRGFQLPDSDLLPPPGGPVPPGTRDLRIDPIEPGIPTPPNSPNGRPDSPPGKITLPGVSMLGGLGEVAGSTPKIELKPSKMRIDAPSSYVRIALEPNPTQPKRVQSNTALASSSPDANSDDLKTGDENVNNTPAVATAGVDVVIRADDQYGHPIALLGRSHHPTDQLRDATTAAPRPMPKSVTTLSVIALDPTRSGEESQLGQWDFDTEQIRQLETSSLSSAGNGFALTVPIRWRDQLPAGETVVFFARLQSGGRDLRCEAEIELKKQPSMAGWLPRR